MQRLAPWAKLLGLAPLGRGQGGGLSKRATAESVWKGATWALDGNGRAYNTPTLGAEIVVNGGFDSATGWTLGTGWSVSGGVATLAAGAVAQIHQTLLTAGIWYQGQWTLTVTAFTFGLLFGASGSRGPTRSSSGTYVETKVATGNQLGVRGLSTSSAGSTDDVSYKPIVTSTLFRTCDHVGPTAVAAKIRSLAGGSQAGVVMYLDSVDNPQNYLVGYLDGQDVVRLDKFVGGTRSSLASGSAVPTTDGQIEVRRLTGNQFQLWYNGAQMGVTATVNDAGVINNTRHGLFSTRANNTFSEFSLNGAPVAL